MDDNFDDLAPCGVFCGACPSLNKSCKGCASDYKNQSRCSKWSCKIRTCCYDLQKLDFCISCEQFPCKIINKKMFDPHKSDPRYTYRFEIPVIFSKLKTMSIKEFHDFQVQRWKCDSCNGTIQFYHYICNTCGKELMIK